MSKENKEQEKCCHTSEAGCDGRCFGKRKPHKLPDMLSKQCELCVHNPYRGAWCLCHCHQEEKGFFDGVKYKNCECKVKTCEHCQPIVNQSKTKDTGWEVELGQLCSQAWKGGLWHSEETLLKDLKLFIFSEKEQSRTETIEEILKEVEEELKKVNIYFDKVKDGENINHMMSAAGSIDTLESFLSKLKEKTIN